MTTSKANPTRVVSLCIVAFAAIGTIAVALKDDGDGEAAPMENAVVAAEESPAPVMAQAEPAPPVNDGASQDFDSWVDSAPSDNGAPVPDDQGGGSDEGNPPGGDSQPAE